VKNPWLSYTLIRLGMFFALFWILLAVNFNPYFSAIIAAVVSFAISLIFLDKQRNALSESVSRKLSRDQEGSYKDEESDLENRILDSETNQDKSETDK
jgi:L-lactate permease